MLPKVHVHTNHILQIATKACEELLFAKQRDLNLRLKELDLLRRESEIELNAVVVIVMLFKNIAINLILLALKG